MGLFRGRSRHERPAPFVRVAIALHEPEANMLISVLRESGIPAMQRRSEFDNPGMLAAGPREILVPAEYELEARALLEPLPEDHPPS
jgi:hypothetical protein